MHSVAIHLKHAQLHIFIDQMICSSSSAAKVGSFQRHCDRQKTPVKALKNTSDSNYIGKYTMQFCITLYTKSWSIAVENKVLICYILLYKGIKI